MRITRAATVIALTVVTVVAGDVVAASAADVVDDVSIGPQDFSNPTQVTNDLAPQSELTHVIMLGKDEGESLRVETTLLPGTKTIEWQGGSTDAVVSQYLAIADGRIVETAYDWFAQDDAGNVWYFGEDVDNFVKGRVANHDGAWIAGRDGPPGMLMPADPQVGDVFHPENIPGLVYEKDRVTSTSKAVAGPSGPIDGVLAIREELQDGTVERKQWAPGYGEFRATTPGLEDVKTVFALPVDAQADPVPAELADLQRRAVEAFQLASTGDWSTLGAGAEQMTANWDAYRARDRSVVPEQLVAAVEDALDALANAIADHDVQAAKQAVIATELAAIDVMTTHGELQNQLRIDALRRQLGDESGATAAGTEALISVLEERP
jgi:hypothetical protein